VLIYVTLNLSLTGDTQILEHSRNRMSADFVLGIRHIGIRVDLINRYWGFDRGLWICFPPQSKVLRLLFYKV